ncbi:hydroxyethylthiazole kinase [Rickettsiella endosymbiont of Miltochrista miniata]|uniref:hydroxyethylthiazole kinase n=1 Tax=Rickettsiella endosymbiont of Miltochrista miniata TaxID=3066239 RepID=UPI00313DF57D
MKTKNCLDRLSVSSSAFTLATLFHDVDLIRLTHPLIHNITNLVVMPTTANMLLALGAAPIMAHAEEELEEIIQLAQALVINIGTLDAAWLAAIEQAQRAALRRGIPVIFDPVGVGASTYRTTAALNIIKSGVDVIRGNASEIMALLDTSITTKGVDSTQASHNAVTSAQTLAQQYQCIVVVSGKIDFIVGESMSVALDYGTPLLTKVVGMGCSLTAIIASFLAVNPDRFNACVHAMAWMGLVSEVAEKKSHGPGSFYNQLLDCFYAVQKKDLQSLLKTDITV